MEIIEHNRYYEKVGSEVKDITDDLPFEISDSWVFVRLSTVCWLGDVAKSTGERLPYLDAKTLRGKTDKTYLIDGKIVDVGKKVILVDGENSGEVFDIPFRGYMGSTFKTLETVSHFNFGYLNVVLDFYRDTFRGNKIGAAIPHLNKNLFKSLLIGIPPIAEQARIVAEIEKFEPLIAEYDKLEQQATKLDDEIYDKLKKSILQYAIQGKLVPQDPNDEPASVLIERIRAEKKAKLGKKYIDSYIYKGDDNCYYEKVGETVTNISDEIPFDLPENWAWCRLQTICSYIHRGKSPTYGTEKILPIIAQKCNQWAGIQTQKCLFSDRATIAKYIEEQYLRVGDIIINSTGTGTVGRTGYVDETLFKEYPKFVADSHVTVVRPLEYIDSKYIYLFLKSPVIQTDIEAKCSGSTNQIELATKTIQSYLIPLPPVTEQYRITSRFFALEAKLKDEG